MEKIRSYCVKKNFSFLHLNINKKNEERLSEILYLKRIEGKIFCIISMLHYGLFKIEDKFLYDYVNAPFIIYAIDPVSFMFKNVQGVDFDRVIIYTHSEPEAEEWRRYVHPGIRIVVSDASYPVHPNMVRPLPTFDEYKAKCHQAVVPMNFAHRGVTAENLSELYRGFSIQERKIAELMVSKCLEQVDLLYRDALDQAIEEIGAELSRLERQTVYEAGFGVIKIKERQRLVDELIDHPVLFLGHSFPPSLFAKNQDKFLQIFNNNSFEVVSHSKVGIAVGNSHCQAQTIRLMGTILLGSAGMVENTRFNREAYPEGSIHLYDYSKGRVSQVLEGILSDDEAAYAGIVRAYEHVYAQGWIDRSYNDLFAGIRHFADGED